MPTVLLKIRQHAWLAPAIILLAGLAMRLLLLPLRWINPDEGAHLMDARLLLQGLAPLVDFGSKQPFYIAVLAGAIKLFGAHLWAGRLVAILCQTLSAWVLYAIATLLADRRAGVLAAGLYSFYPFVVIWAPVVKTEPLAILLAVLSVYFFLTALRKTDVITIPLFLAGVAAGLAYYVRQSTLYLPLSTVIFLCCYRNATKPFRLAACGVYSAGFSAVCAAAVLIYSRWMSLKEILFSAINPLELLFSRGLHVLGLTPEQFRIADSAGFRIMDQEISTTVLAWQDSLLLTFFFFVFLTLIIVDHWKVLAGRFRVSLYGYPAIWLTTALVMYLFQSAQRGFFSQYFVEILTPALLLIVTMPGKLLNDAQKFYQKMWFAIPIFFMLMALLRVLHWSQWPPALVYWPALALLLLRHRQHPRWVWPFAVGLGFALHFAAAWLSVFMQILVLTAAFFVIGRLSTHERSQAMWSAVLLAFFLTAGYSGSRLGPRYECVWSPKTLKQVTQLLVKEGTEARVLAGATIWAFQSGLKPWLNIAHPTEVFRKFRQDFAEKFDADRPEIVIVDGYTHRKYARYWPLLKDELKTHYELTATFSDSSCPVQVYRLLSSLAPQNKDYAEK